MTDFRDRAVVTVSIDGTEYPIQRFRALRAVLVMAALADITNEVPELVAKAASDYAESHSMTVTEAMSRMPRFADAAFTEADFDRAERETGKREVKVPIQASGAESLMSALPTLIRSKARRQVVRLFAILLIPNDKLKEADRSDSIDAALDGYEDLILYEAELDELADIAEAVQNQLSNLNTRRNGKVGKMLTRVVTALSPELTALLPAIGSEPVVESPEEPPTTSIPQTSTPDAQTSPTPSDLPTVGTETPRSTEPLGVS